MEFRCICLFFLLVCGLLEHVLRIALFAERKTKSSPASAKTRYASSLRPLIRRREKEDERKKDQAQNKGR